MFDNEDEVFKYISDEGVQYVDVRFCDLPGQAALHRARRDVRPGCVHRRPRLRRSSVTGFQTINESDMLLMPDPATMFWTPSAGCRRR